MFPYRILRQTHLAKQFILLSLLCYGVTHAAEQQNPAQLIDEDKPQTLITLPEAYLYMGSEIGINHYQHGCESWSIDCDKKQHNGKLFLRVINLIII